MDDNNSTMIYLDAIKIASIEDLIEYADKYGLSIAHEVDWALDNDEGDVYLTTLSIINPENAQKLIYSIILKEDEAYEEARKELTVTVTKYFSDWKNTTADEIRLILIDDIRPKKALIDKYNGYVEEMNEYKEFQHIEYEMSLSQMENVLENNIID